MPNKLIFDLPESVGAFATECVELIEDARGDAQPGVGGRTLDGPPCGLGGVEDDPTPGALDLAEEAMLNGVPLGGVGRIVGDAQAHAQALGQGD